MSDRSWMREIALAATSGGIALMLAAAPVAFDGDGADFASKAAFAKAGDKGGDKGDKGADKGNKGGKKGGTSGSTSSTTLLTPEEDSHGKAHKGKGNGHFKDKDAVSGVAGFHEEEEHDKVKSLLGRLSAGNASPTAMANAASHSAVGMTAQYYDKLAEAEAETDPATKEALLQEAASLLADLANKEVAEEDVGAVVAAYNDLLGIEATDSPGPVSGDPGENDYQGFQISEDTEDDLISAAEDEYADGVGGGLGPAPEDTAAAETEETEEVTE